jgi:hypothetical protein
MTLFGGCGSEADTGGDTAGGADAAMTAEAAGGELSCWLRGTTVAEAMARPSPLGDTDIILGGTVGKFCYGRPTARGRQVEGGLIPFGDPWRMGANEATAIHLVAPARVGTVDLEPGSYSVYTIAGESEWQIVLNSEAERWGIPISEEVRANDLGSFMVPVETLDEPVETLTATWEPDGPDRGHLVVAWGTTQVQIPVSLRP